MRIQDLPIKHPYANESDEFYCINRLKKYGDMTPPTTNPTAKNNAIA